MQKQGKAIEQSGKQSDSQSPNQFSKVPNTVRVENSL